MVQQLRVYLFGDQTYDISTKLLSLLRSKPSPLLQSFFDRVYQKLRTEIGTLPTQDKEIFPRFSSIAELLEWRRRENKFIPPIENALTCIYQLGHFISEHDGINKPYPSALDTCVSGLCTGALSAAAVSCCKTASELVPIAAQTVLIAFRTGHCAMLRAKEIDLSAGNWSMVVSERSTRNIAESLDNFCQENNLPVTSQPWISAHGEDEGWLSISGTPSVLARLKESKVFDNAHYLPLGIYAPYHASHIFSKSDIAGILETTNDHDWEQYQAALPVLSSTTGVSITTANFRSRLEAALYQILIEPILWAELTRGTASVILAAEASEFRVIPVAMNATATLTTSLSTKVDAIDASATAREPENNPNETGERPKIAIVGMSGRYPSAENNDEFWDLILRGLDVHKRVPEKRWSEQAHVDPSIKRKNTSAIPYGCWLDNPGAFDAPFFHMSPREAPQVDPAQRIALMTAYEAIEQAGIVSNGTPSTSSDRVGVFYGVTSNDWMETNSSQDIDTYFIPGGNRAFIPGRINYFFKFSGPSYIVDTACSSSLASIHVACNSLWERDVDTAIAGGTNVLTNPDYMAGLDRGHFLSRTGNCKTFDDDADGYCRGEGVGTLILKRLEDALADKDPIQGLILGAYTNHSAEAESITRPHVGAQSAIMQKVLCQGGVDPYSVGYVEMHGTGTQAGDSREMTSVLKTFAPADARHSRQSDQTLHLGSVKANIGHGEGVSGASSMVKTLLMMRHDTIPPHCGIKNRINSGFPTDLESRNVYIAKEAVRWTGLKKGQHPRRALVNNFSAAGGNSAVLLEEGPVQEEIRGTDPRTVHVVTVSAKSFDALKGNIQSLIKYIESEGQTQGPLFLPQLSYTTTARRMQHQHRVVATGSTADDIKRSLEATAAREDGKTRVRTPPKMTFAFTGQGAQYIGMGRQLYELFGQFRRDVQRFDDIAQSLGFPSFKEIIDPGESGSKLTDPPPVPLQLASVCMQMALSRLLISCNITPDTVVGHSLGEYAALNVAGVLSDADTIFLVGKRAQLLEQSCTLGTHSMLVVRASLSTIQEVLGEATPEAACLNAPEETVLAGPNAQMQELQETLGGRSFKTKMISVPFAYHSSQVDPILDDFEAFAAGVQFCKPKIPVISPLLAEAIVDAEVIGPEYLRRHCRETVRFVDAVESAKEMETVGKGSFFVEIGPHSIVTGMIKSILGTSITAVPVLQRKRDDLKVLTETLASLYSAGADIAWREYHRDFDASHRVLELPAYNWILKDHWIPYLNDWTLRKGDPPLVAAPTTPISTTIHKVLQDSINKVVVESDMAREDFNPLVQGHEVDGVPLCTPSVYADISLTLGKYLVERYQPEMKSSFVSVMNMTVLKALIAKAQGPQPLQTSVTVDWPAKKAKVSFCSFDKSGQPTVEHATCEIHFKDGSRQEELQQSAEKIKLRMAAMRKTLESGETQVFNRAVAYKMIGPLAQFHQDYRPVDEILMDGNSLEVVSRVNFNGVKATGTFFAHPAFIDGLSQAGGFVLNCRDSNDLAVEVFVNHGWDSLELYEPLEKEKTYRTYCQMSEKSQRMFQGDVIIFDESDKIVASYKGMIFQGVPRRVLRFFLRHDPPSPAAGKPQQKTNAEPAGASVQAAPTQSSDSKTRASNPSKLKGAWKIISEEAGIALDDVTDSCLFADLGVDSLLSLVIMGRFREELDADIDLDDLFIAYPSVKEFNKFISGQKANENTVEMGTAPAAAAAAAPPASPMVSRPQVQRAPSSGTVGPDFRAALAIVSEESGIPVADLTDDRNLADIGIDSLLSLVIFGRFKEDLDVDVEGDSLFTESSSTIKDLKALFSAGGYQSTPGDSDAQLDSSDENTPVSSSVTSAEPDSDSESPSGAVDAHRHPVPAATSVLLQGMPKYAQKTLFLLPDGSGSATSYSGIPRLGAQIALIGLNSPYYKIPELFRCTVDELIDSYLAEIRRRQPAGPYHLGGWSAGGILAYRATQKLIMAGETVASLVLIDSPVPKGLDKLPQRFYDHCSKHQIFGHGTGPRKGNSNPPGKAPAWLVPHFNATIDTLHHYHASPLPAGKSPRTSIIWASESVMDGINVPKMEPHSDDTAGMKFLSEARTDFSTQGWGELFPDREIALHRAQGANHFSMMRGEHAPQLASFLVGAIG